MPLVETRLPVENLTHNGIRRQNMVGVGETMPVLLDMQVELLLTMDLLLMSMKIQ
jgi:hypothetical protein